MKEAPRWIDEVAQETGLDEHRALLALGAVLQALRDELTPEQNEHLTAQMPAAIRELYFEDWDRSHAQPACERARFFERVEHKLRGLERTADTPTLVRGILRVFERHMRGLAEKIKHTLPKDLRDIWPSTIAEETLERQKELAAQEREIINQLLHAESGHERGAPLAPHQNRSPGEEHRGGPLPNQKK